MYLKLLHVDRPNRLELTDAEAGEIQCVVVCHNETIQKLLQQWVTNHNAGPKATAVKHSAWPEPHQRLENTLRGMARYGRMIVSNQEELEIARLIALRLGRDDVEIQNGQPVLDAAGTATEDDAAAATNAGG